MADWEVFNHILSKLLDFRNLSKKGTVTNQTVTQVAAKLLKGILIRVAAVERERLLKQREDVLKRYSEHKKRQEEEQKVLEEDKV